MRAAVISYHSSPLGEPGSGDAGGMTVYVRELARALAKRAVTTDVYTRAGDGARRIEQIAPGVRVIELAAGPARATDKEELPSYVPEFTAAVRSFAIGHRLSYDLVHSHYWQSGLVGRDLAEAWQVPLVHSHHTLGLVKNSFLAIGDAAESDVRLAGERRVIGSADVLIASTDAEQEQLAGLYGASPDRLKTLHPGVDHDVFSPGDRAAARRSFGFGNEAVLLYVGRIQRLKGIDLAVRALEQLRHAMEREVILLVVGGPSGPGGAEELNRLARLATSLGVAQSVRFVGPHPHGVLPRFYRAADAVLVCSHTESFGFAALEAHACGTPVVGTAVGGLSHIVRDGRSGFLVAERDAAEFAARLKPMLSDDAMHENFSREAIEAAARFSWSETADGFLDLYDCLIREQSPELCTC